MKETIDTCRLLRRTRVFISIVILILSIGMITACSQAPGSGTIIAGSTSAQPYAEVLAEEYMVLNPDSQIDIQGGGSSAGITAAQTQSAEIGMSSRGLKDEEKDLWNIEIARDGLVLIVNPNNPVQNLNLDQICDIYSGIITDWSQLGGSASKINLIAREEGSGTRSAFTELVMGEAEITPKAIVQDSNGSVMQLVTGDPNAIGFISLGLVNDKVKALHLDGVEGTAENIMNDSYMLARPFLFVSKDEPTGLAKSFIDFTLSLDGQKLLSDEGLIPSGEAIRK
ncbi:MAG TPA: phosphate ABC transporter substrate-binding protein [Clostridiales bacterium]|nr:phosphate ABC transporter substrate-binding protein [Clostridiales bacterium]